jgi:TatD DNase family protein
MNYPAEKDFIDIHTHSSRNDCFCMQNLFAQDLTAGIPEGGPFSAGLHPWHILDVDYRLVMKSLEKFAADERIIAIGETGLDRNKDIPFELQEKVFLSQVKMAEQAGKPVVIHCVKAYSDLMHIRKNKEWKMKWMFHWFNENLSIANELINLDCYLSFGRSLFHPNGKNAEVFQALPLERIFLETDDAGITIENVYTKAAELKNILLEDLKQIINRNYKIVFLNH